MTAFIESMFGPWLGELYALACALMWAVAIVLFRVAGTQLGPFALNLYKNVLAMLLLVPTIAWIHGSGWPSLTVMQWALLLFSGFIGIGLADTLYFRALNQIGASRTAVGGTMLTPLVIALSFLFLGERLSVVQCLGAVVTLAGVLLVNYQPAHPLQRDASARSLGLLMLAMVFMAVGIVITKPILAHAEFLWIVEIRILGGVVGMVIIASARRQWGSVAEEFRRARRWPLLTIAAFIGAYLAMLLWLAGYKYSDASIVAVLNESAAVFVLLIAALFLGERLTGRQWLGSAVAVAGVLLTVVGA